MKDREEALLTNPQGAVPSGSGKITLDEKAPATSEASTPSVPLKPAIQVPVGPLTDEELYDF